jgi:hypothetical protein
MPSDKSVDIIFANKNMVGQNGGQIFFVLGFMSAFTIPSGNLPNASSVGANTVKGPSEVKASSRSAAFLQLLLKF